MREVEDLDLRPDAVLLHPGGEILDEAARFSYTIVGKLTEPVESDAMSGLR